MALSRPAHQRVTRTVEACVPEPDSDHIKSWGRKIIGRASQESAIALHLSISRIDLRNNLHHLAQPTLILQGEADALVSVEEARQLAEALPNAKLTVLPGAGHVPTMTRPLEVAREIKTFFGPKT